MADIPLDSALPALAFDDAPDQSAPAELVVATEALPAVGAEWEALARSVGAPPFLHPGWFGAWSAAFARGRLTVLTVRDRDRLMAVLPLVEAPGSVRAAANDHSPLFGPISASEAATRRLGEALVARGRYVDIPLLDVRSAAMPIWRDTALSAGLAVAQPWRIRQPYVELDGSWSDYEASLPRKMRREMGRATRRLSELGTVEFSYEDSAEHLDEGLQIEGSGWKDSRGTAIASSSRNERFYRAIAEWAAERGWLRLAFLRVDGRAVAFDLCLEADGVAYALKGGYDPEFRRFGPGVLLIRATLAHGFEHGIARYELLGVDDAYKLAWANAVTERARLQLFPKSVAGTAHLFVERAVRPAAKRAIGRTARGA